MGEANLQPYTEYLFLFFNRFSQRRLRTIAESQKIASRRMKDNSVRRYLASSQSLDKSPSTDFGSLVCNSSLFDSMQARVSAIWSSDIQFSLSSNPASVKSAAAVRKRSWDGIVHQADTLLQLFLQNVPTKPARKHVFCFLWKLQGLFKITLARLGIKLSKLTLGELCARVARIGKNNPCTFFTRKIVV